MNIHFSKSPLLTIWWKEVRENLRDRRAVLNALVIGPLLTPLLLLVLIQVMVQRESRQSDRPVTIRLSVRNTLRR